MATSTVRLAKSGGAFAGIETYAVADVIAFWFDPTDA